MAMRCTSQFWTFSSYSVVFMVGAGRVVRHTSSSQRYSGIRSCSSARLSIWRPRPQRPSHHSNGRQSHGPFRFRNLRLFVPALIEKDNVRRWFSLASSQSPKCITFPIVFSKGNETLPDIQHHWSVPGAAMVARPSSDGGWQSMDSVTLAMETKL